MKQHTRVCVMFFKCQHVWLILTFLLCTINWNSIALKKQVSEKNAEISELKIKIDELRKLLEKSQQTIDNDKKHYLSRLNQKQNEIEQYKA